MRHLKFIKYFLILIILSLVGDGDHAHNHGGSFNFPLNDDYLGGSPDSPNDGHGNYHSMDLLLMDCIKDFATMGGGSGSKLSF